MSKRPVAPEVPPPAPERLELTVVTAADLPLLEQLVRAYYVEDGHVFHEDRQPTALAALAAGEPFGRAWLIRLGERSVGYVVLAFSFSVEAGGREACVDEITWCPRCAIAGSAAACSGCSRQRRARSACGGYFSRSSGTTG